MNNLIALTGRRKSGKTTAAGYLAGHGYNRLPLALPVKRAAVGMCNGFITDSREDRPYLTIKSIEEDKATFRPLLEWIGITFGREYLGTPNRWIDEFRKGVLKAQASGAEMIVCDDMRLPNEAAALREMGFLIVRIQRPEIDRGMALVRAHELAGVMPSERTIDEIKPDVTIVNDGSIDDLYRQIDLVIDGDLAA